MAQDSRGPQVPLFLETGAKVNSYPPCDNPCSIQSPALLFILPPQFASTSLAAAQKAEKVEVQGKKQRAGRLLPFEFPPQAECAAPGQPACLSGLLEYEPVSRGRGSEGPEMSLDQSPRERCPLLSTLSLSPRLRLLLRCPHHQSPLPLLAAPSQSWALNRTQGSSGIRRSVGRAPGAQYAAAGTEARGTGPVSTPEALRVTQRECEDSRPRTERASRL
ncbi:uncharacterized protein LOC124958891 isoform X2 [Sciurus carolinensis]|uniref:uncharacterized protein LOC124958891 isoform X2 n=1 Tax=Sciurus carolinensis TaxID=30640 RepID=UPI001FB1A7F4|nr:uncharacterized protein LOC124958891 isoform X2 [Sciurus carolinensis]